MKNPFEREVGMVCNAAERCDMVRTFTRAECEAAMQITYLQATVYQAIQRRLRQLERQNLAARHA